MFQPRHCALILATALFAGPAVAATTYTWPGAAPCAGTLQACIDAAANGDRIEVAAATINEDISLYDQDRTLVAAAGVRPAFGAGRWLSMTSSSLSGDRNVSVGGFSFTDGYVLASYRGTGTANYDIGRMTLTRQAADTLNYILVRADAGTLNANVHENRVEGVPAAAAAGMITLKAGGGTLRADAYYNRVQSTSAGLVSGAGILADYAGAGSGGRARVYGNDVRGSFGLGGIVASEGLGSTTPVSFDARVYGNVVVGIGASASQGIRALVTTGTINWQAIGNTVTRVDFGLYAGPYSGATTDARINGIVSTNLVRATGVGLYVDTINAPSLSNDYNLINAPATATIGLGTHTLTAPAQLVSDEMPRLQAGSPAIDAGDTTTLGLGLIVNGLPTTDADGLRRIKGATSKVDIGAYEYGDASFMHTATAANTGGHVTTIETPYLDGYAAAKVIATPNYNAGSASGSGTSYHYPFGVYYQSATNWALFSEDITTMPLGAHFDLFSPAPGSGSFVHVSSAGSISGAATQLPTSDTGTSADAIVLATQNWTAGGGGVYNAHPIGVRFAGGAWQVLNLDSAPMAANLGFNVYAQMPSPNAFRVSTATSTTFLDLDHPLLNGIACARPHVTRVAGAAATDYAFDLYYTSTGTWRIFGYSTMLAGTTFNVVVDPAQVAACTDVIFANGFD